MAYKDQPNKTMLSFYTDMAPSNKACYLQKFDMLLEKKGEQGILALDYIKLTKTVKLHLTRANKNTYT